MTPPGGCWRAVLRRLENRIPQHTFEAWIRPLYPRRLPEGDSGTALLIAPGDLCRDRVVTRYLDPLREAFSEELGRSIAVQVESAGHGEDGPTADSPDPPDREGLSGEPGGDGSGSASKGTPGTPAKELPAASPRDGTPPVSGGRQGTAADSRPSGVVKAPMQRVAAGPREEREPARVNSQRRGWTHQWTFDSFLVGKSNALAQAACVALATGGQSGIRSLCLVGGTGSGKSHLARALVREARQNGIERALYTSAEGFTSDFTQSLRRKDTDAFKRRFRDECDLLVLEDLEFLAGKKWTQLELFHTFEHLRAVGVPVVVTAGRQPREIERLDPRLQSQLSSGLVAEIEAPDRTLRRDILRQLAAHGGVALSDDCLERLVDHVQGSVRDLEGALAQVVVTASLMKRAVDLELVDQSLRKFGVDDPGRGRHDIESIAAEVCDLFGVTLSELREKDRSHRVSIPRQFAMYFALRLTGSSMSEIAAYFDRSHPSVRNSIRSVERRLLTRAPWRYRAEELATRLDAAAILERPHGRKKGKK